MAFRSVLSKRAVLLTGIVLVAAAVSTAAVVLTRSSGDEPAPRPEPPRVYAYLKVEFGQDWLRTRSTLVAMNGTERIGRASLGLLGSEPAFTTDGRFVFSLGGDAVEAISVATGKVTSVPCEGCWDRSLECQCQTVVPIGGSEIAWLGQGDRLVRADLAAASPTPRRAATKLPTWDDGWKDVHPHLLAGTDGAVLATYRTTLFDEPGPVYLVAAEGTRRQLAPGRKDSIDVATFSPDGTRVALSGNQQHSVCATVTVVDVRSGKGRTSPVKAEPGAKCATRDGYVGDLWWDRDGALNAYFQPGDDNRKNSQHRLDGDRWVTADVERATQEHPLGAGAAAILSRPGVRDQDFLFVEIDGRRTKIDGDVNRVRVPPRS